MDKATEKALKLLRRKLNKNQRNMLDKYNFFGVLGQDRELSYLVVKNNDNAVTVRRIAWDEHHRRWAYREGYCVFVNKDRQTGEWLPWPDDMLAFKEVIESGQGESYFLRRAASTGYFNGYYLPDDFVL